LRRTNNSVCRANRKKAVSKHSTVKDCTMRQTHPESINATPAAGLHLLALLEDPGPGALPCLTGPWLGNVVKLDLLSDRVEDSVRG